MILSPGVRTGATTVPVAFDGAAVAVGPPGVGVNVGSAGIAVGVAVADCACVGVERTANRATASATAPSVAQIANLAIVVNRVNEIPPGKRTFQIKGVMLLKMILFVHSRQISVVFSKRLDVGVLFRGFNDSSTNYRRLKIGVMVGAATSNCGGWPGRIRQEHHFLRIGPGDGLFIYRYGCLLPGNHISSD